MSGHGHVIPNEDCSRARCGGPGLCPNCSREAAQVYAVKLNKLVDDFAQVKAEKEAAVDECEKLRSAGNMIANDLAVQKMRGETLRAAIDAARKTEKV